jgi:large subunit ribosomal protein L10
MAKSREKKQGEVVDLVAGLGTSKAVVLADVSKLKVNDLNDLRRKAEKEKVRAQTAKKTLLKIAFKESGKDVVDTKNLPGSVSLFFGMGDEVSAAKVIADYRKGHENVKILGGILESKWMSAEEVMALAKLPSKQELIAQVVGTIRAPLSGFVNVLQGNVRGLVYAIAAIRDKKS